jgi:hypothetical protein
MQNGDTLLMCVATSQILYSFIMAPSTLPHTYVRFITRMGGKDPSVWAAIRVRRPGRGDLRREGKAAAAVMGNTVRRRPRWPQLV